MMRWRRTRTRWRVLRPEPQAVVCGLCGAWYASLVDPRESGRPTEWAPDCVHSWEQANAITSSGELRRLRRD